MSADRWTSLDPKQEKLLQVVDMQHGLAAKHLETEFLICGVEVMRL